MKYAIIGPRGHIFEVLDAPTDNSVELSDEQAATFNSTKLPLFLVDGELKTFEQVKLEALEASGKPAPREIANWRARAVLEVEGLLSQVDALIEGLTGPEGIAVKSAWKNGAPIQREGSTVQTLASQLNLSKEQLDSLFRRAAALVI